MSLVIIGSLAFDTIETPLGRREGVVGGSATYCALAASYFTRPRLVGVVGEDFPASVIDLFQQRKIDLTGLERRKGRTFHWEGRYGRDPNQRLTIKLELNVFQDFRPVLPRKYRLAKNIFLANIDPDLQEEILRQVTQPRLVAMDTIDHWIKTKREALLRVLKKVNIFFANDEEAKLLTEEINLIRAGRQIQKFGPELVIIKKGEHGALVFGSDWIFGVLAHPCEEVIDPTGAGDCFAGGFLGYLDRSRQLNSRVVKRAAVYGSVMASLAIEDFGIERLKALDSETIKKRFLEFKRLVTFS
ncbi:MAG TPA: sugar kinase [Candidatus Aminicenantes bacterium]|nr:sugar kinase [Candidatus Aminicenantes bacterium]